MAALENQHNGAQARATGTVRRGATRRANHPASMGSIGSAFSGCGEGSDGSCVHCNRQCAASLWWPSQAVKMPASLARPTSGHQKHAHDIHREPQAWSPRPGAPRSEPEPSSARQMLYRVCYTESAIPSMLSVSSLGRREQAAIVRSATTKSGHDTRPLALERNVRN